MNNTHSLSSIPAGSTIGITGASGLVGSAVCSELEDAGYHIIRYSRKPSSSARLFSLTEPLDCTGVDAMIHLAGESIHGIWTAEKKRRIYESRVIGTRQVVAGIRQAGCVKTLINASAIGYYGQADSKILDETCGPGRGFLAEVCQAWEAEALEANSAACRVALMRLGLVLGRGGALALMTPVFRAGMGGQLGSGRQWMSAIHVCDVAGICRFLLENPGLEGPVNVVMPEPFTNAEFTKEMGRAVGRPTVLPVPAFALRLALGGLSDLLLGSSRVVPKKLLQAEYKFHFPALRDALKDVLQKQ